MPSYQQRFYKRLFMATLFIWVALIMLLASSCGSMKQSAIIPEGQLIERDGDRFLIIWKDMGDKPHSYAYNWVYLPELAGTPINIADYEAKIILQKRKKP